MSIAKIIPVVCLILIMTPGCGPDTVIENSIGMKLVRIPAGEFQMGSDQGEEDEKPSHTVRITQPFYMGMYEVTQAQWEQVMETSLTAHYKTQDQNLPLNEIGPEHPMYFVSWEDTQAFIDRLNTMEGKPLYRLPTEAEWEYAARAGTNEDFAGELDAMAWYAGNAEGKIHPAGQLKPNAWGLYDMHGNVWEWCHDWLDRTYYSKGDNIDPQGGPPGERRIIRGGCWYNEAASCRLSYRSYTSPGRGGPHLGFRIVRMAAD